MKARNRHVTVTVDDATAKAVAVLKKAGLSPQEAVRLELGEVSAKRRPQKKFTHAVGVHMRGTRHVR